MNRDRPHPIRVIEHVEIPMADGYRLAAKIWLPADAEQRPVPAVLEYIPYRKRDFKAVRDAGIHGFFAAQGYAGVRVDLRGSGDSDGVLQDEYLPQELDDGLAVIRWLARQPWCNGRVGMFGLSWGGFNALQLAALQPPELGAVISVCSSDDRYATDVHYMGGCLLTDNLSWASTMFAYNSCPPDPAVVGERWRTLWLDRLQSSGLWLANWLHHQRRDAFWKHGSVCEDYTAIRCPVFAVSGWADGYTNTVFHLMENLQVPRRGLVGPWGHKYPHMGGPGPSMDFLGECVRWWDRWLGDGDASVDADPMLQVWMQDSVSPLLTDRPGHWVAVQNWPSEAVRARRFAISRGCIEASATTVSDEALEVRSPLSVGLFAGKWCSYAESTDLPTDQREEDGGSLLLDSAPLEEDLYILGAPSLTVTLTADRPQAMIAARLSDIAPDGAVNRVTYGLLNLSHRFGHETPEPLIPGHREAVMIPLNYVAQHFPAGHRLRVAVSTSYWPLAWPAPEPPALTLHTHGSHLTLPVYRPQPTDGDPLAFDIARVAESPPTTLLAPAHREWQVNYNLATNEAALLVTNNDKHYRLDDIDLTLRSEVTERYSYQSNNYDTVRGEVSALRALGRPGWQVETHTHTVLTSSRTHFRIRATLDAYEGDTRVFANNWDETIPRDHI
ncbi:CocE/NonD family hydrolase [Arhodomonas sp. AD133]|uniref:CocE/NonD family hydrolase n=1 Tax=Arhodomonas sp. AD133 TaxID=3415009 RepID=UPI003EBE6F9A